MSKSNLVKKSDTTLQDHTLLAREKRRLGPDINPPGTSMRQKPSSRAINQCTGDHPGWAFISSACHLTRTGTKYRAYKTLCSRQYKVRGPMGEVVRSRIKVLSGHCLPEEICVDGYGPSGKAFCVRQDLLIGMAQNGLTVLSQSKATQESHPAQKIGTSYQDMDPAPSRADRKKHALMGKSNRLYKRGYGTIIDQCPGKPDWHVALAGCHAASHRKYWVVCSEPVPIWQIPREISLEGTCGQGEICINTVLHDSTKPTPGLENHYYSVARCVKLADWALYPAARGMHVHMRRSRPANRLANHQKALNRRTASSTASERLIKICAGELWNWPVVLSACNSDHPRKYYTVCAEPIPIWHIPKQVRTEGQCDQEEICVDGHRVGGPIKGLEHFEFFFAKCVQISDRQGSASPSIDRSSDARTPPLHFLSSPNPRPPTASSTSKPKSLDDDQTDGTAKNPQHGITKRNAKWHTIYSCPGDYSTEHWLFWRATCDPNSPRDYTIQCMQRINGAAGALIYGQMVFTKGQCSEDEICFQGHSRYSTKCVSHEAFASIAKDAIEGHNGAGKSLIARHIPLEEHGNLSGWVNLTSQKNWHQVKRCFGDHAHWPVGLSAYDVGKGLRAYYFRCTEPDTNKGQARGSSQGASHCENNELCVGDEAKGIADLDKKCPQKTKATETQTVGTANAAQTQPAQSQSYKPASQPTSSPENEPPASLSHPKQRIRTPRRLLGERDLSRLINECPGPHHIGWEAMTSDCIKGRNRDYRIWCKSPDLLLYISVHGRCSEDEVCLSDYSEPPSTVEVKDFKHAWYRQHGMARCVEHESFTRLAAVATTRTKAQSGHGKRSLEGPIGGRILNQCPEDSRMTVWTSVCHPNEPRKYFITCRNPQLANFIHRISQCSEDEICVSGYRGEVRPFPIRSSEYQYYGLAKCVKQERLVAAVLASKRNEGFTTSNPKRLLSRQLNWRPINQCPHGPHIPIIYSVCDPNHPRRYLVTCIAYGHHVRIEQRGGEYEKDEVCVSGYTDPIPINPVEAFLQGHDGRYGIANCVKHESFARIAQLANKSRKMGIKKTGGMKKTEHMKRMELMNKLEGTQTTEAGKKKTQVTKQGRNLEKRTYWHPISICPGSPNVC